MHQLTVAGNTDKYDKKKLFYIWVIQSHILDFNFEKMCNIAAFGVLKNVTSRLPPYHVFDCCGVVKQSQKWSAAIWLQVSAAEACSGGTMTSQKWY